MPGDILHSPVDSNLLFPSLDPNSRFRERRQKNRQQRRRRRTLATALLLAAGAVTAAGALYGLAPGRGSTPPAAAPAAAPEQRTRAVRLVRRKPAPPLRIPVPYEIRGVHVTMALASIPGKFGEYIALRGLNTLQLDIKDENGEVAFVPARMPIVRQIGAGRGYYKPKQIAALAHRHGIYLVGRVVVFEDPILSERRPGLAIRTADGSVWRNHAGLGWTNPYDRRVWDYNIGIGEAAARAGFDEIQFDYVRFPSDGDISAAVFPGRRREASGWTIARFLQYASKRLRPLGVRVSADVFGLSATRDLGIGQVPRRIAQYVDALYPMVYPSHYGPGEYDIDDPNASPGPIVAASLRHFRRELRGRKARVTPWLQDFSLGRSYSLADVQQQIDAARKVSKNGFLLWNAAGVYTEAALSAG